MSYVRTPAHRRLRAELIKQWRPWEKSTGPKSVEGKVVSALRGYKGGERKLLRDLAAELRFINKSIANLLNENGSQD